MPIGRYASNPDFQSNGRSSYPIKEGCIHDAWSNGWLYHNGFPDPNANRDDYVQHHIGLGIPRDTAEKLTMKSRLYCGCRVMDQNGKKPIAVVVIESTDPDRFSEDYLRKAIAEGEQQYLSEIIHKLLPDIAMPSDAAKAGL